MYHIHNHKIAIHVAAKGAEIQSIFNKDNTLEYLWQADSKFWGRHAPVLFPIVGQIENNHYFVENKKYQMSQHGFARDQEFALIAKTENKLIFELRANQETKKCYPFDFALQIGYELIENKVAISYCVKNKTVGALPFSIGAHPGFRVPLVEKENLTDYYLEFEQEETLDRILFEEGLLNGKIEANFLTNTKTIPLSQTLFENDALIFKDFQSKYITLKNTHNTIAVKVGIANFPYLGIWSPPNKNAPFVCIEPWYGIADTKGAGKAFAAKEGRIVLPKNGEFECSYSFEIF